MATLKVFVSSTCYDLHAYRAQLRATITSMGYEPVMSDHSDVVYDPRVHTHTSCLREVPNCDVLILIIGSRFGGATVPKALDILDLDTLGDLSRADTFRDNKSQISITQAEVIQAIQNGLPIFAFVDSSVLRDHKTYEKNKNKAIIADIDFSSIEKSETASYIFEFINFIRLRNENNSIFEFTRFEDIDEILKKQWAGLFQRLLHEQRTTSGEAKRIDTLSSQIADLKTAVLSSISSDELKETAKGAIKYRHMIELLHGILHELMPGETMETLRSDRTWSSIMDSLAIISMHRDALLPNSSSTILARSDGTWLRVRLPLRRLAQMEGEWDNFRRLSKESRSAIMNAVLDTNETRAFPLVQLYAATHQLVRNNQADSGEDASPATLDMDSLLRALHPESYRSGNVNEANRPED